jgi:predicted nucleic acid-binding protein
MIVLDTNVVSEAMKAQSDAGVLAWLNRQSKNSLYLTSVSLAEIFEGIALLPEGRRKESLRNIADRVLANFTTPVLPFNRDAAVAYASVMVRAKENRYRVTTSDGFIAAIAKAHGFAVATRDVTPFRAAGVAVINPWEDE